MYVGNTPRLWIYVLLYGNQSLMDTVPWRQQNTNCYSLLPSYKMFYGLPGDCFFKPKIPKSFLFVFSCLSSVCDFSQNPLDHCWHKSRKVVLIDFLPTEIRKYKTCQDKTHTCEIFIFILRQKDNKFTYFQAFASRIGLIPYHRQYCKV